MPLGTVFANPVTFSVLCYNMKIINYSQIKGNEFLVYHLLAILQHHTSVTKLLFSFFPFELNMTLKYLFISTKLLVYMAQNCVVMQTAFSYRALYHFQYKRPTGVHILSEKCKSTTRLHPLVMGGI